ncbi:MAG: hypothetical protein JXN64_10325 [Spirochaetes bacterium]|nr:hypothetical protein [Spirochaetota bacterium]
MKKNITDQYMEKIEKQLRELGNKIDDLNAKIKEEGKLKYNETRESLQAQMEELFRKVNTNIDTQLNDLGAKIETLTGKAKEEAKNEYQDFIKNLHPRLDELKVSLNKLKNSSDGALADIKTGAVNAWKELKKSFNDAVSKFK